MKQYKLGWIPEIADQRDKIYQVPTRLCNKPIPDVVDLRNLCSLVENQTTTSSCVAHGLIGNLEILEGKNKTPFYDISRLFVYYNARSLSGSQDSDSGTYIRDGIKALAKYGYCSEKLCQFKEKNVNTKPTKQAYQEGKRHLIKEYKRILTLQDMIYCLMDGYPVVFGITLYESFMSEEVKKTGLVPIPKQNERAIGGHCMCAVGFNHPKNAVLVRNSWGNKWGINGYCYIPFHIMETAQDCWTIKTK